MEKIHHVCNTYILNKNLYNLNKNKVKNKASNETREFHTNNHNFVFTRSIPSANRNTNYQIEIKT